MASCAMHWCRLSAMVERKATLMNAMWKPCDLFTLRGTFFFFSSRRRHTRSDRDWSSDVCSSDLDDVERSTADGLQPLEAVGRADDLPPFALQVASNRRPKRDIILYDQGNQHRCRTPTCGVA